MQATGKRSIGFGFRGTMVMLYQFLGYVVYTAFTNFPQNVLSKNYGGSTTTTLMTLIGSGLSFVITYFIIAPNVGRVKSWKRISLTVGPIALAFSFTICLIPPATASGKSLVWLWAICFLINNTLMTYWGAHFCIYIIGNWFPRRKGTVMGITTMAFPLMSGIGLNLFLAHYTTLAEKGGSQIVTNLIAFSPWWIAGLITLIIGGIFVKDYPEQCGAYRDNDPSFTKEMAMEMLQKELEARKNSVWKRSKIWGCPDWYMIHIPASILLAAAMAFMVQIIPVLYTYGSSLDVLAVPGFILMKSGANSVLFILGIFAMFGSWLLGVIDTRYGTKTAIFITAILTVLAGVLGMIHNVICTVAACWILGLFMGAASNFGLSCVVRYWRREDFQAVSAGAPPVGTAISAVLPYVVAALGKISYDYAFLLVAILGVACIIMNRIFNEKRLADYDKKLREAAGLPADDVLYNRIGQEKRFIAEKKAAKLGK